MDRPGQSSLQWCLYPLPPRRTSGLVFFSASATSRWPEGSIRFSNGGAEYAHQVIWPTYAPPPMQCLCAYISSNGHYRQVFCVGLDTSDMYAAVREVWLTVMDGHDLKCPCCGVTGCPKPMCSTKHHFCSDHIGLHCYWMWCSCLCWETHL